MGYLKDTQCQTCRKGTYRETSIHDDWDGILHCTNCSEVVTNFTDDGVDMKELVKTLAEQAGFAFWQDEPHGPGPGNIDWSSDYTLELERFADLLVKQCANAARDYAQHVMSDDRAMLLRKQILDHFDNE